MSASEASTSEGTTSTGDAPTTTDGEESTTASCEPSEGGGGSPVHGENDGSTTDPACVPTWAGCPGAEPIAVELAQDVPIVALLSAPDGGMIVASGEVETELGELRRASSTGEVLWAIDPMIGLRAAASSVDDGVLAFGFSTNGAPGLGTIAHFDDDGMLDWSHGAGDSPAVFEDADCPLITHDPAVGWLVGCVVSGRFGGDGLFRLHTYADANLSASVTIDARFLERMQAAGSGRVIVSSAAREGEPAFLASVEIATGELRWTIESEGEDAPRFAIGADVVAVLRSDSLDGIDGLGQVLWTTALASEPECNLIGRDAEIVWTGESFLVAGTDELSDTVVVHHVAPDGTMLCGDGVPTPATIASQTGRVWLAGSSEGAWIGGRDQPGRCDPAQLWATRSTAP